MILRQNAMNELTQRILPFWKNMRDSAQGGYYGAMPFNLQPDPTAEKGSILHSRILWFFSSASLALNDPSLLEYAHHVYRFLARHAIDPVHGGVFWSLRADGTPADSSKHTYCQAFAVYALSAYYRASGNLQALEIARQLFRLIEERCTDSGGYREAFGRDWQAQSNEKLSENGVLAARTMNTLLHIFEAYAELYEAAPDPAVEAAMRRILQLFLHRIYQPERQQLGVFFDEAYRPLLDLHSYGHDIEAAWLLDEGAALLDDPALSTAVSAVTDRLSERVYRTAYHDHSLWNERENGVEDKTRVWWVQAEAVVGFFHRYQKHPEQTQYLRAAENIWGFIQQYLVDRRPGSEWFWSVDAEGSPATAPGIAGAWKCPYHNGRMCIELLRRLPE